MSSRILSRNILAGASRSPFRPVRTFVATPARLNAGGSTDAGNPGNSAGNPSYPAFSLKHISPNRRTRILVASSIFALGCLEGATWVKFWPKIMGKEQAQEEGSQN